MVLIFLLGFVCVLVDLQHLKQNQNRLTLYT